MAKIIVADMDKDILELYSEELSMAGYDVAACNDGHKVIRSLKRRDADVLILDVEMLKDVSFHLQGGDGDQTEDPPVVILTFHENQEDMLESKAFSALVKYHVRKSFCLRALKESVVEALDTRGRR